MSQQVRPVVPVVASSALLVAALCDLPAGYAVEGVTASAVLSGAIAALGLLTTPGLLSARNGPTSTGPFLPFALFTVWSTVNALVHGVDNAALQNLAVFWLFLIVGLNVAGFSNSASGEVFRRRLAMVGWSIGALYLVTLVHGGLGARGIVGPRSFALEALLVMCMAVPYARSSHRALRWLPIALLVLIAASLSRTAMVVALLLVAVRVAYTRRGFKPSRTAVLIGMGVAALCWAVLRIPVLNERFTGGDQGFRAGGLTISLQGRGNIWGTVLDGYQDSPLIGHGPGSVRTLISSRLPGLTEPHNEFLRVLYDTGWIGVGLLVWALVALLRAVWKRARFSSGPESAAPHVGALLALLTFIAVCMTDNALIYSFVMAPLAVIVGTSLSQPLQRAHPGSERTPATQPALRRLQERQGSAPWRPVGTVERPLGSAAPSSR